MYHKVLNTKLRKFWRRDHLFIMKYEINSFLGTIYNYLLYKIMREISHLPNSFALAVSNQCRRRNKFCGCSHLLFDKLSNTKLKMLRVLIYTRQTLQPTSQLYIFLWRSDISCFGCIHALAIFNASHLIKRICNNILGQKI